MQTTVVQVHLFNVEVHNGPVLMEARSTAPGTEVCNDTLLVTILHTPPNMSASSVMRLWLRVFPPEGQSCSWRSATARQGAWG